MLGEAARSAEGQSEKDARIADLEKKVAGLEGLSDKAIAMEKTLERPKKERVAGTVASEADALNALLRQLNAAHKVNMEDLKAEKDREVAELKKTVADVLERVGIGNGPLSEHEAKKARLTDPGEFDTRHACD